MTARPSSLPRLLPVVAGVLAALPAALAAQTATANLRGVVTGAGGAPVTDAQVAARYVETNQQRGTITNAAGFYYFGGLRPGRYEITVRRIGFAPQTRTVQVQIGRTHDLNVSIAEAAVQLATVTAEATAGATTTRTSEVGTNVTREQIQSLPQQDRNFLNFAGLAPGVTPSRDEQNKQIRAGGLSASRINVFVDGASYKNDILEGGVHGQDASRGNPFPQLAIREFRVITQNFKAEYQRAASAVVTATTRSGTNEFEVDGFALGQNRALVTRDPGARLQCSLEPGSGACGAKPQYQRLQAGVSVGGPIVRDRLFFFGGYEGNIQDRDARISVGRPEFRERFRQYEGVFTQPFRSHLPFGKLTWQAPGGQTLDLSYTGRIESDKRGFGGTRSFESAENVEIGYHVLTLQHGMSRGAWSNQAHVSAQRSTWNPTVVNQSQDIGQEFQNVITVGARDTEQRFVQDRVTLRNDLTRAGFRWAGTHVFKGGGNVDFLRYDVSKRLNGNPLFVYNPTESMEVPIEARYGLGDPGFRTNNVQFGAFLQDDWDVSDRLQLNLGLRWDAETNLFNNDWVTPDSIRRDFARITPAAGQRFLNVNTSEYFTRGRSDRPMFLRAFQPRVGFSYDVAGGGRTVVHGGFGVYYDREVWNRLIDERFRLRWATLTFPFTTTGEANQIPWRQEYLSRAGLESILASANAPGLSEVFLLNNNTRPPRSNQWNLGVRQTAGTVVLGTAYRGVRGYNILSWQCATPHSEHGYCEGLSQQGNRKYRGLIVSTDEGRSWYDALDLTLDRPMTDRTRWGATFAYTFADGRRTGNDFFTLSFPGVAPSDWPRVRQNVERHRVVASGIAALPAGFQLSGLAQWGSGIPFDRVDEARGWGPAREVRSFATQDARNFSQFDLRVQKNFPGPGAARRVGVLLEVLNVFDRENFREFEQVVQNNRFGQPLFWTGDMGRRLQLGVNFGR
jgi:hypothetical protein